MNRSFGGRSVILTGAASGIGRAMARILVNAGATVFALDLDPDGLASLLSQSAGPGTIHPVTVDVCDRTAYATVIQDIQKNSKSIDFLFNNAGVTLLGEAHKIPFERWKWLMDINLMGVVNGTMLVYPIMISQGSGHITNTSSVAGATGYATAAAYTTSKAAVIEFSRSLRAEAKGYGVMISVACPGYVDSGIFTEDRIVGADLGQVMDELPVKLMTPDEAAGHFLRGVAKRKPTIVFPFTSRFLWFLSRWAPIVTGPIQRNFLKSYQKS